MAALPPDNSPIEPQKSKLTIPPAEVDVPMVHVQERDWLRIRRNVATLGNPIRWARDAVGICIGLAVAFGVAFLVWSPVYDGLDAATKLKNAGLGPFFGWGAVATGAFALLAFVMNRAVEQRVESSAEAIVQEMDEIHTPPAGTLVASSRLGTRFAVWVRGLFVKPPREGQSTSSTADSQR